MFDEFKEVFSDKPGLCNVGEHEINVTDDFVPKRLKAYRIPELLKPEVARQIQQLLDWGFIRPSSSSMASPVVVVLKGRHGQNGVRICVDYKYLNKYTKGMHILLLILLISFIVSVKVITSVLMMQNQVTTSFE